VTQFPQPWQIENIGQGSFTFAGGTGVFAGAAGGGDLDVILTFPGPPPQLTGTVETTWVGSITLLPPSVPGDYDTSGTVEQADLDLVLLNWGVLFDRLPEEWGDQRPKTGSVDQAELDAVLLNWGMAAAALGGAAVVPEPSSDFLAALAVVLILVSRPFLLPPLRRHGPQRGKTVTIHV
jgi:hypothetical protein